MFKKGLLLIVLFSLFTTNLQSVYAQCPMNDSNMMAKHQQMMHDCLGPVDKNYDLRFLNMMIMHHQQAVMMAQNALINAKHPELKQLAQNIITNQTQEINQMKAWRKEWYGK